MTKLTAEFVSQWLPSKLLPADADERRLEIVLSGVFWEGSSLDAVPEQTAIECCLPWTWPAVVAWQCWAVRGGTVMRCVERDVQGEPQALPDAFAKELMSAYAQQVKTKCAKDTAVRTLCLPAEQQGDLELEEEQLPQQEFSGWHRAFIAQKAQMFAPLNIALKLAWITKTVACSAGPDPVPGTAYAWLPVWASRWDGSHLQLAWDVDRQRLSATFPSNESNYEPLQVYARVASEVERNADSIMQYHADGSFEPLRLGESMSVTDSREWLSGLSQRAALTLDLPHLLVRWLQDWRSRAHERDLEGLAGFLKSCRQYVLDASRDITGFGIACGPDGRSTVMAVWRRGMRDGWWFVDGEFKQAAEPPIRDAQKADSLRALTTALTKHDKTYDHAAWKKVITHVTDKPPALLEREVPSQVDGDALETFLRDATEFLDVIRRPAVASTLIKAQYKAALHPSTELPPWLDEALTQFPEPTRDQSEGLLEPYWKTILHAGATSSASGVQHGLRAEHGRQERMARALRDQLASAAGPGPAWTSRFGANTGWPDAPVARFPALPVDPFTLHAALAADFAGYVMNREWPEKQLMKLLFPSEDDVYPAPTPVCVAVDLPAAADPGRTNDLNDHIAGVLLFCREEGKPWRALNRANIDVIGKSNSDVSTKQEKGELLIASPVGEQDGVRGSIRQFGNENLSIVLSPGEHVAPSGPSKDKDNDNDDNDDDDAVIMSLPSGHRAPCLHYGRTYGVAGALLTNAGVLPPSLRRSPDRPEHLTVPALSTWSNLENSLGETKLSYRRRVPVGPIRLTEQPLKKEPQRPLSSLPVRSRAEGGGELTVRPLACELAEWSGADSYGDTRQANAPGKTLLVVFPGARPPGVRGGHFDKAKFDIAKPATGFWNWFAWEDDWQKVGTEVRVAEWTAEVERRHAPDLPARPLDDPAVADLLLYELEQVFPSGNETKPTLLPVRGVARYAAPSTASAREHPRSGPITVIVETIGKASVAPPVFDERAHTLTLGVPEGTVHRLRLRSLVTKGAFETRFHACMTKLPGTVPHEDYYAVTPVEVWIEAAASWTETLGSRTETAVRRRERRAQELWRSLRLEAPSGGDRQLTARMVYPGESWMAQIGRVDILHQVWRWDGRDVDRPLLDAMLAEPEADRDKKDSASQLWEGSVFATRPDHASQRTSAQLTAGVGPLAPTVFVDDLRDDPRCVYHRFGLRAFSRYEAVYGDELSGMEPDAATPWRRLLVKAARTEPLPRPALRFALPLTRDVEHEPTDKQEPKVAPRDAASVMLVLDEIWFAEAGLAEGLEVGIRVQTDPTTKKRYVNAGFDPTLTTTALEEYKEDDAEVLSLKASVLGPYGLTLDFAAKQPKLNATAFILRVPTEELESLVLRGSANQPAALPWFMCEVAVRRTMPASDYGNLNSEWSARSWVQFVPNTQMLLPPAWRERAGGAPPLSVECSSDGICAVEVAGLPRFDESFEERHERWLVLSERVFDIKGHPVEKYRATFVRDQQSRDPGRFLLADGSLAPSLKGSRRSGYVRLLLVRRRPGGAPPEGSPWERLFKKSVKSEDESELAAREVKEDATCGAPIVTARVAVEF